MPGSDSPLLPETSHVRSKRAHAAAALCEAKAIAAIQPLKVKRSAGANPAGTGMASEMRLLASRQKLS